MEISNGIVSLIAGIATVYIIIGIITYFALRLLRAIRG